MESNGIEIGGLLVAIAVAFVGGSGAGQALRMVQEWRHGKIKARRDEVDRISVQLDNAVRAHQAAEERVGDAIKRAHLTLVWARRLELLAVKYGVPESEMPVLDFKDGRGGEKYG